MSSSLKASSLVWLLTELLAAFLCLFDPFPISLNEGKKRELMVSFALRPRQGERGRQRQEGRTAGAERDREKESCGVGRGVWRAAPLDGGGDGGGWSEEQTTSPNSLVFLRAQNPTWGCIARNKSQDQGKVGKSCRLFLCEISEKQYYGSHVESQITCKLESRLLVLI